jgi:hypothetical protein
MIGKPDSVIIKGTLASLHEHNLKHSYLTAAQVREKVSSVCRTYPCQAILNIFVLTVPRVSIE